MELGKTQQRIDDLYFYLYNRPLHPELFHVYAARRINRARYQADICIIGLSHLITVQFGGRFITELTASQNELLPKAGLVTSFRFRGERDHDEGCEGGLHYMMSSQVERMSGNLFEACHRDLIRHAKRRGLLKRFEQWSSEGLVAFTFIDYEAREREFHVHAFHAFPEDHTLLKLQSIFEIGPHASKGWQ